MATGSRALGTDRQPQAWQRATAEAQTTRSIVAGQIADLLVAEGGEQMTGAFELVTARVVDLGQSRKSGDPLMMRAAAMGLAVASGALVVRLDLKQDHPGAYRL